MVGMPDEKWGEAPHAFVVFKPGASASAGELREFCRLRIARFKVPHSFTPVPELPKTATGAARAIWIHDAQQLVELRRTR